MRIRGRREVMKRRRSEGGREHQVRKREGKGKRWGEGGR